MKLRLYGRFTNVLQVYSALLNCYARAKLVKKAEAVIQQMKHMGFARSIPSYNILLKGIVHDRITYAIQISAYLMWRELIGFCQGWKLIQKFWIGLLIQLQQMDVEKQGLWIKLSQC
nr:uncharacterized protein LOC107432984 [Ziziphus jujuba var. spinosa]